MGSGGIAGGGRVAESIRRHPLCATRLMPGNKAIRKRHAPRKSFALPPPSQRAHPFRLANIRFFERKAFRRRTYLRRGNTAVGGALRKRQRHSLESRIWQGKTRGRATFRAGDARCTAARVFHPKDSFHSGGSASQVYGRRRGVAQTVTAFS